VNRTLALTGLGSLCAVLTACGGSPPPPPAAIVKPVAAVPAAAPTPPPPAATPAAPVASLVGAPAVPDGSTNPYDPKNRRDPFMSLEVTSGPKGLEVATTKLTGIVRGAGTTLALVETQDGIGYILKPGDTLGDGRLVEIGADSAIFAVAAKPGAPNTNRVVLKLAAN
jgi:hypothetical protein